MSKFSYQKYNPRSSMKIEAEMQVLAQGELSTHRLITMSTTTTRSSIKEIKTADRELANQRLQSDSTPFSRVQLRYILTNWSFKFSANGNTKRSMVTRRKGAQTSWKSYILVLAVLASVASAAAEEEPITGCDCPKCGSNIEYTLIEKLAERNASWRDAQAGSFLKTVDEVAAATDERPEGQENGAPEEPAADEAAQLKAQLQAMQDMVANRPKYDIKPKYFDTDGKQKELIRCPVCKYEILIASENGDPGQKTFVLKKKVADKYWHVATIGSFLTMGSGFIGYMVALRNGDALGDARMAHAMFLVGAALLLLFLVRGRGFDFSKMGPDAIIKFLGFSFGMASMIAFVDAVGNVTPEVGKADLDFTQMYEQSDISFNMFLIFGTVALAIIMFINVQANCRGGPNAENLNWLAPYGNGLSNLIVFGTIGVGTPLLGDMCIRWTMPEDYPEGVGSDSLWGLAFCVGYLTLFILWRLFASQYQLLEKPVSKIGLVVGVISTISLSTVVVDALQHGADTLDYTHLMAFGGAFIALFATVAFVLKLRGAQFNCWGEDEVREHL